jgi:hypothetical protein
LTARKRSSAVPTVLRHLNTKWNPSRPEPRASRRLDEDS